MNNFLKNDLNFTLATVGFLSLGVFYYWLVRESTVVSEYLGIVHFKTELSLWRIDWFPSFVHQFSFVIFTWLALGRTYLWFSLIFWFVLNSLFELGEALPSEYCDYFTNLIANYLKHGTYSHAEMFALVVASFLAYIVINKKRI